MFVADPFLSRLPRVCVEAVNPGFLAKSVASALLAGEWSEGSMTGRIVLAFALPKKVRWVTTLVRFALRRHPSPPHDARDALAESLVQSRVWSTLTRSGARVRRILIDEPAMRSTRWAVPEIPTMGALAAFLGVDVNALDALADRRGLSRYAPNERMRHYRIRLVAKKDGSPRLLEIPKQRLRDVQRMLLDRILAHVPPHDAAHGFRRGRSVLDFARPHLGQRLLLRLDLRDFFGSIGAGRVYAVWRALGYPEEVARTLTALTTHRPPAAILAAFEPARRPGLRVPHLPQGAPTSPALANLVAFGLDIRLAALARTVGATYGRYADDIALSGGLDLVPRRQALLGLMLGVASDEGYTVSPRKTRVLRSGMQQKLGGLVVNRHLAWPRVERERFEAILTNCVRHGPESQNREGHADFRAHLTGRLAWLKAVNARHGAALQAVFERIDWAVGAGTPPPQHRP